MRLKFSAAGLDLFFYKIYEVFATNKLIVWGIFLKKDKNLFAFWIIIQIWFGRGSWSSSLAHWGRDKMAAIFQCFSLNENVRISISNIPAFIQIMAWHWPGDKPLSEPMMVSLLMHICVTQPPWVKEGKDFRLLPIQYHSGWWPGETRSQGISELGIDPGSLEYSISCTEWVKPLVDFT